MAVCVYFFCEESGVHAERREKSRESKGSGGNGAVAECRNEAEESDESEDEAAPAGRRENDESGKTARWHMKVASTIGRRFSMAAVHTTR